VRHRGPDSAGDVELSSAGDSIAPSTDGVVVTVHDLGGTGRPLLMCHATGFHGRVWQPVADRMPDRHCIAPDLRGHGDTALPDGVAIDWQGFGDDVLAVVDALGLTDVLAVGHSKGGAALLLAEQARPGTFAALYLYEPVVVPSAPGDLPPDLGGPNALADGALRRRASFDSFDAAYENFAAKPPLGVFHPAALRAYVDHGFRPEAGGGVTLKCRPEVESQVYRGGASHGAFAHLGEVRCPVTVARGRSMPDVPDPARFADAVAEGLPHGRLEEHPDLGHFGPLEDPDAIATAIDAAFTPG
jgi:pimeloyl-ACP methyl ester carboxylesterase